MTPFKLFLGVEINHPEFQSIKEAVELEHVRCHEEEQEESRQFDKEQILKVQVQQQHTFKKFRKDVTNYYIGDLVTKRTQFMPTSKLCKKFIGPYHIIGREGHECYKVIKIGSQ